MKIWFLLLTFGLGPSHAFQLQRLPKSSIERTCSSLWSTPPFPTTYTPTSTIPMAPPPMVAEEEEKEEIPAVPVPPMSPESSSLIPGGGAVPQQATTTMAASPLLANPELSIDSSPYEVSRWVAVQQHMKLCDQGDTGPPIGQYDSGSFTPPVPMAHNNHQVQVPHRSSPAQHSRTAPAPTFRGQAGASMSETSDASTKYMVGDETRWVEVQQRMHYCDSGDTGARSAQYTKTTTPYVPVAREYFRIV